MRTNASPETLVCGFSSLGLAGLTAANYLVEQLVLEQVDYIDVEQFPAIAPFENGVPRRHTRLFGAEDSDLTGLVGELFVPPYVAGEEPLPDRMYM
ncbi:MAG: PAC2 family protein [Haloglomus sp.]